ncbi:hypothetical protein FVE85_4050 [Porphyridium purpureum]|uniref:Uncharacterized protein n=1 Tax=Porphyridium purpureum TaxID=35688 RepID=A0A5J4YS58_PORPP|nr:hypothetical protein FVE85_4050 [Porphyridium purpureum]|eukprot:POR1682..scf229_5
MRLARSSKLREWDDKDLEGAVATATRVQTWVGHASAVESGTNRRHDALLERAQGLLAGELDVYVLRHALDLLLGILLRNARLSASQLRKIVAHTAGASRQEMRPSRSRELNEVGKSIQKHVAARATMRAQQRMLNALHTSLYAAPSSSGAGSCKPAGRARKANKPEAGPAHDDVLDLAYASLLDERQTSALAGKALDMKPQDAVHLWRLVLSPDQHAWAQLEEAPRNEQGTHDHVPEPCVRMHTRKQEFKRFFDRWMKTERQNQDDADFLAEHLDARTIICGLYPDMDRIDEYVAHLLRMARVQGDHFQCRDQLLRLGEFCDAHRHRDTGINELHDLVQDAIRRIAK